MSTLARIIVVSLALVGLSVSGGAVQIVENCFDSEVRVSAPFFLRSGWTVPWSWGQGMCMLLAAADKDSDDDEGKDADDGGAKIGGTSQELWDSVQGG